MKKLLPYILIVIIFAQLFVPFTIGSGVNNKVEVKSSLVEAADAIKVTNTPNKTDTTITGTVRVVWWNKGFRTGGSGAVVTLTDPSTNKVLFSRQITLSDVASGMWTSDESKADSVQTGNYSFPGLKPSTDYVLNTVALQSVTSWWSLIISGTVMPAIPDINTTTVSTPLTITTSAAGNQQIVSAGNQVSVNDEAILPTCSWNSSDTWGGCFGRMFYWILFKPTSYIFGLTGRLLDISVDYSTKDTSYRSTFVTEGWGVVRDFCNMFFIFVMLYIAFGTILKLHSVKTKEMIINVVIIGLLINFSLFATQVIIDASNILTRVFYNSQTIQIGPKVDGVVQDKRGSQGEIQLSAALVSKINPQKLILQAYRADNIQTAQTVGTSPAGSNGVSASTFILVSLLAAIVNIVGIFVFLTAALVFITRVIGLWLAMIFAPLAFFSYTVPALQDTEMVGWKKWWPETLKMAFLAPVFVFFMYLIIKFLDTGLGLLINDNAGGLDFILGIFVPFIFIMILLTKAKDITVKMAGKMGEMASNAVGAVRGVALGAGLAVGTGGAAMAMRGTLGAFGSKIGNSEKLAAIEAKGGAKGWMAGKLRDVGTSTGKVSFDVRNTKLGASAAKSAGITSFTKGKEGGFDKYKEEKDKKRKDRAEKIKTITTKAEQKNAAAAQIQLKETMLVRKPELDTIDKLIAKTRQEMTDANNGKDKNAARAALVKLQDLQANRDTIRGTNKEVNVDSTTGAVTVGANDALDSNGKVIMSIDAAEKAERDALHNVAKVENKVLNDFANSLNTRSARVINLVTSLGQDRRSGVEKTAMDIKAGKKVEKDKGDVGHH